MEVVNHLRGRQELPARRAILLYEDNDTTLATVHEIMTDKRSKKPMIGAGRCLTRDVLTDMVRQMSGLQGVREILPASVLLQDAARMLWWVPSARRPIYFLSGDKAFNKDMNGKHVLYPPLVMMAEPGKLCVFALAEDKRPDAKTMLYRAPFYNLYAGTNMEGLMCAGNVRLPDTLSVGDLPLWERAFFETQFTHANTHTAKLTRHPAGHNELWMERMIKNGREDVFPAKTLVSLEMSLGEVANR